MTDPTPTLRALAIEKVMIGGNHLASALIRIVGGDLPHYRDYSYGEILVAFGHPCADMWVAWKAIMDLRDALEAEANTGDSERPRAVTSDVSSGTQAHDAAKRCQACGLEARRYYEQQLERLKQLESERVGLMQEIRAHASLVQEMETELNLLQRYTTYHGGLVEVSRTADCRGTLVLFEQVLALLRRSPTL